MSSKSYNPSTEPCWLRSSQRQVFLEPHHLLHPNLDFTSDRATRDAPQCPQGAARRSPWAAADSEACSTSAGRAPRSVRWRCAPSLAQTPRASQFLLFKLRTSTALF